MSTPEDGALPLSGVRILDLATFLAAPFTASTLSEFGAEVIKIERPDGGDPWRRYGTPKDGGDTLTWKSEGRNKSSLTLNLRAPEGVEILSRMSFGLICDRTSQPSPHFSRVPGRKFSHSTSDFETSCFRISGYGQDGPYRDRPA